MLWEKTLNHFGVLIEERLRHYFAQVSQKASNYHPFLEKIYSGLENYAFRKGKRLASCSTLLMYKGYTGLTDDRILNVAVGVEVYRHCILVHDDLVDRDDSRRGGKTIHKMFCEGRGIRFGEGVAVFLGDIAYTMATEAVLNSGFEKEKIIKVLHVFSEGFRDVNESQILDLYFESEEVDVDDWYVMASKRAASLFKITMLTGAVLADAPEKDLKLLEAAAMNIGYAFDIQDDIIDTYASEAQYGRLPGRDLTLNKKPLHIICALHSTNRECSEALKKLMGKQLDPEQIKLARLLIKKSGGLEKSKKISKKHAEKAKRLILKTSLNEETKRFFTSFVNYVEESLEWYK